MRFDKPDNGKGDKDRTSDFQSYWETMDKIFGKSKSNSSEKEDKNGG